MPMPQPKSSDQHSDPSRQETIESPRHMATILTEANRSIYTLQMEALNEAIKEHSAQLNTWLQSATKSTHLLAEWNQMLRSRGEKFNKLTHDCLAVTSQTAVELQQLIGKSIIASPPQAAPTATSMSLPFLEKRDRNIVLSFPDRRIAASLHRKAAAKSSASQQRRAG